MKDKTIFGAGVVGTIVAALCCFTPALGFLLGAAGVSAALAWLDFVLLPLLVLSIGVTGYAWSHMSKSRASADGAGAST